MIEYAVWTHSKAVVGQQCRALYAGTPELTDAIALVVEGFCPKKDVIHDVCVYFDAKKVQRAVRDLAKELSCHDDSDPQIFWSGEALHLWADDVDRFKSRGAAFRTCNFSSNATRSHLGCGVLADSNSPRAIQRAIEAESATVVGQHASAQHELFAAGLRLFFYYEVDGCGYFPILNSGRAAAGVLFGYYRGQKVTSQRLDFTIFAGSGGH